MSEHVRLPAPVPPISPDTEPFWAGTLQDQLLLPRCLTCARYIWYPKQFCSVCMSTRVEWVPASGRGEVYSFTVMRSARSAGPYGEALPYVLAFVTLEEGPTIMTNITGTPVDDVEIGMPVQVEFHRADDTAALPRFRPVLA